MSVVEILNPGSIIALLDDHSGLALFCEAGMMLLPLLGQPVD